MYELLDCDNVLMYPMAMHKSNSSAVNTDAPSVSLTARVKLADGTDTAEATRPSLDLAPSENRWTLSARDPMMCITLVCCMCILSVCLFICVLNDISISQGIYFQLAGSIV